MMPWLYPSILHPPNNTINTNATTKFFNLNPFVPFARDLEPDIIFVDGNGRLHPRGAGLACHLGVVTGLRTIGVGKTFLHVDGLTKTIVREVPLTNSCRRWIKNMLFYIWLVVNSPLSNGSWVCRGERQLQRNDSSFWKFCHCLYHRRSNFFFWCRFSFLSNSHPQTRFSAFRDMSGRHQFVFSLVELL